MKKYKGLLTLHIIVIIYSQTSYKNLKIDIYANIDTPYMQNWADIQ